MSYFIYFKTSSDLLKIAERLNISYDLLDYFIYNFIESAIERCSTKRGTAKSCSTKDVLK